ncbi:uncharacterized protein TNCV_3609581 [Trichonephila clavipes]|nr:uncharacterized protein TNCV_3609581 [Trichonephila clavipes]
MDLIKKTPTTKQGGRTYPNTLYRKDRRTKRSIEAERRRGEGKNAGRKAGRPKAVNQGDPSHQIDTRQGKPPTEGSRQETSGQYDKARETKTTTSGTNRAAERRAVRSKQTTAGSAPHSLRNTDLRSRVKQPEGIPEERRSNGIDNIPQNNIKRRSLSMEALDGDPVDRSE